MKRPLLVWCVFAACIAVGCGVFGWFTTEMLRLERAADEARRVALREENIRLALWRMDSALAAVHGLEAARPWRDYEPFHPVEPAYSSSLSPLPARTVWAPSPLLQLTPPFVRLHFQIEPDGTVTSPQAPGAGFRAATLSAGVSPEALENSRAALDRFRESLIPEALYARATFGAVQQERPARPTLQDAASSTFGSDEAVSQAPPPAMEAAGTQQTSSQPDLAQQQLKNVAEQRQREDLVVQQNTLSKSSYRRNEDPVYAGRSLPPSEGSSLLRKRESESKAMPAAASPRTQTFAVKEADIQADQPGAPGDVRDSSLAARDAIDGDAKAFALAATPEGPPQALWTDGELVLVRRVEIGNRVVVQGAWLDWPEIEAWLLARVTDLLPGARLQAAQGGFDDDSANPVRRLAFLPVNLAPGPTAGDVAEGWSPLRVSLGAAWLSAGIGTLALALLLRGTLRLSERRGAFVSAVTHELRTPLTTFRMYTEMLSGGMVTDDARRKTYLDTLHKESERLSHLVENVLAYSRIERGRAASRVEETTPAAFVGRIEDRLRERLAQGGLALRVHLDTALADRPLRADTSAIEQVLFNLVDNATKYGRPAGVGGKAEVGLEIVPGSRGGFAFRVIDHGPGIPANMRRRLFQPFSKSAVEAAHSQPGVGLGLALCRRLAREELHGDLVLERTGIEGTIFRLELPSG